MVYNLIQFLKLHKISHHCVLLLCLSCRAFDRPRARSLLLALGRRALLRRSTRSNRYNHFIISFSITFLFYFKFKEVYENGNAYNIYLILITYWATIKKLKNNIKLVFVEQVNNPVRVLPPHNQVILCLNPFGICYSIMWNTVTHKANT